MAHSQLLCDVLPKVLILKVTNTTFPTWKNRMQKTIRKINLRNDIYELILFIKINNSFSEVKNIFKK